MGQPGSTQASAMQRLMRLEAISETQTWLADFDFDLDGFMAAVVERVPRFTNAEGVVVELVEGQDMVYRATSAHLRRNLNLRLPRADSFSGLCVEQQRTLLCRDSRSDPRVNKDACDKVGARSMVCAPLLTHGRAVGVLKALSAKPDHFTPDDVEVLSLLARSLAAALSKQLAYEALQRETEARRRLEISLRASEAHARAQTELFENGFRYAPIAKALVGLDGRFIKVNAAFTALVGYEEAEMLDLDFQHLTHPDDLDRDLGQLAKLTAGEIELYQMDKRYIRKDGRMVWVSLSVSLVRERSGEPKHYIAQVLDLTKRMEAEARYQLMAENTTDMIVTSDMRGRPTFVSAACTAMTGWTVEGALGRNTADFAHPDDLPGLQKVFARTAAGESGLRVRWRGRHADGRWIWLESSPSLLTSEDDQPLFVDVVRDISAQVAQEQALEEATQAAEAASAAKTEFLANMSHEIRTPLTAVIGFNKLLLDSGGLTDADRGLAERVGGAGRALLAIVNDILDYSKIEAGQYKLTPRAVVPADVVANVIAMFESLAADKGLDLSLALQDGLPRLLLLDPERLSQILVNLIGNAVKFTDRGGVTISVAHAGDELEVSVRDTGPGMNEEDRGRLFQRFTQLDSSTTRRHGGTGLGLAICRGLSEAMGGGIDVTSTLGEGSCFRFWIRAPIPDVSTIDRVDSTAGAESLLGVRVLVVDDNPSNRDLARATLEVIGAEVSEAADGLAALEAAAWTPLDVILLDVRMPGLDGPATLERLRVAEGPNQTVPVLCFTADADVSGYLAAGFDGVVRKPIETRDFLQAVSEAAFGPQPVSEFRHEHGC
ncbi:PAS domain S-box protein [Phenylobacterium montanum]|uniref:histidine kinase n=1 Tax=Phenylobacterium montanum TaxID=2823693 RepID=A0A975G2Z0_9CAUL|nr:PAS domain S-box protein [Caulobacter sp. S6]QUD90178.1 PAS domain S-box protein [Caulobacter sp. S6]